VPHFLHTLKTLEDFEYAHFIHYNAKLFVPTHLSIHFQWWGQGCICIIIETDYIWTTKVGLFYVIFNFSLLISSVQLSRITQFFYFFLYLEVKSPKQLTLQQLCFFYCILILRLKQWFINVHVPIMQYILMTDKNKNHITTLSKALP
jgi:hypothetical protein